MTGLSVPKYQDPYHAAPLDSAYVWLAAVALDGSSNTGRATLNVHPDQQSMAAGKPPIDQIGVSLGQVLVPADPTADPPKDAVTFPTLDQLMADEGFARAFATIRDKLYEAVRDHPRLANATPVEDSQ